MLHDANLSPDGQRASPHGERPNVIIYLVDTLRPDHLGCYGYPKATSPHIDAFAKRATLFRHAVAQSSWTRASVASIFTGLTPQTHRTNRRIEALPASAVTLAELLAEAGYETAAFITNGNVASQFGFAQGFHVYEHLPEGKTAEIHQLSDRLNQRVFEWLDQRPKDRPFFLYLHPSDPHGPYAPREPYRARFARAIADPFIGSQKHLKLLGKLSADAAEAVRDDLVALYDAEIAFNDASFGALLERLRRLGIYDSSLMIFVADHGEEFYEHRGWGHGNSLHAEQVNIPLMVKFPGKLGSGRRISRLVQHVDILPTILTYLGRPVPPEAEGHSVLSFIGSSEDMSPDVIAFLYLDLDGRQFESVISGPMKLIRQERGHYRKTPKLYDWRGDPGERDNLARRMPDVAGRLKFLLANAAATRRTVLTPSEAVIDDALAERLRALGYLKREAEQ